MLREELQERLVKGHRILDRHGVGGLGNGHQAAAGNAPHDDLSHQRKISRRLFPAHDERRCLHAAKAGAGDRWRRRRGDQKWDCPGVIQDHLTYGLRLLVEGPSTLVVHPLKEQLGSLHGISGLDCPAHHCQRFAPVVERGLALWNICQQCANSEFRSRETAQEFRVF
jgi:hypothetical protein